MNEIIKEKYNNMVANSADFRRFINLVDKIPINEIICAYGLKNDVISCCSGLSEMPASKQAGVVSLRLNF